MEIIKIVCHKRYPEDAISNLVAVLSAIHTGERVPMPEIKDAALNAVAELENRFGPESAAVRALIEAEEFDHVKVNFMVSDIEGEAASVYWNIHDLPASAKTDRVFWGDLLQRTDAIWQQIKKLQKVVENREKVADSKNRLKADEAVEKMVKEAKGLSDQAAKVLFEAAPSTQEMASLQKRMNDAMDHLETFQMNCLPKVTIPGEGQFWVCLSNRANAAVRELSRMDEAMKEKSKIADKVELKIAKLELACKEQISKVKACMEAGPAIGLKSKDILYAISEVDDHASELHDALVEKREAAIGPVKEYWASCVKRVSKAWAEMTGAEDELMLILDNQNQKLQAVDKLCQQGGHLLDLSGRMLHDGATVDTLRGMCDSMKELSLQIEPLRKGIANAHLNSKGDEKQFWHGQFDKCVGTECLSNRANAAVRELSRMDEAMKEKSKIADKVELKIAKLELACKEQISKVKACMEAGPAIGLKSKDILYAISEVDDHASELHDALVEKREAAIGPVKEYWASCVKRVSKAWAEMTGAEDELMLILDNQNQKLQAVDKLCQQGGHLLDLSGRMLHDGATVDTLRGMCDSMKELSLQIEPLRKGIANAHLNSKGDEKQFWHGQFDKCVGTEKSLHMRMTRIEEVISTKNAEAQRAQAQRGQTNRFAMRMPEICKENNRLSDLVAKAMNDEKNPASAKRQLLTEVADFYKQCIMFSNKLCGYLRNCGDSEYEAIREMLNCIAGIRRNCVTMTSDLRKALAMDKGMEKLLSAIFDAPEAKSQTKAKAEPSKVEPQFNADAEVQSLLGCADKAELLAKLKTLQEKLGA